MSSESLGDPLCVGEQRSVYGRAEEFPAEGSAMNPAWNSRSIATTSPSAVFDGTTHGVGDHERGPEVFIEGRPAGRRHLDRTRHTKPWAAITP